MINEQLAHKYCKDDITKIENYNKAIDDTTQTWDVHHRLEFTLDGEFAHSPSDLKRMNMYYDRPYFELIFLTKSEHIRLHRTGQPSSADTRKKISEARKGHTVSEETKRKISEAHKGKKGHTFSDETKQRISEALKGRTISDEHRKKISEARKAYCRLRKQQV